MRSLEGGLAPAKIEIHSTSGVNWLNIVSPALIATELPPYTTTATHSPS